MKYYLHGSGIAGFKLPQHKGELLLQGTPDEKDAEELLEALQFSLRMNRAMINSIIGGKDK